MLAALLLLGLLPLATLPLGDEGDAPEEGGQDSEDMPDQDDTKIDMLDEALTQTVPPPAEIDDGEGQTHEIAPEPGITILEGFEPDQDIVELDLTGSDGGVAVELGSDEDSSSVSFLIQPDAATTVDFAGLEEVPSDDIMLRLTDGATGEPYALSLSDALNNGSVYSITGPVDPDTEDEPPGGEDPVDPVGPVDPDTPDELTDQEDPDNILQPVEPTAEELGDAADQELNRLLERDSENTVGRGNTLLEADEAGTQETKLTGGDDALVLPGGAGGAATITMSQAVPEITSGDPIQVVDGDAGDDTISLSGNTGFAFGGEGNDALSSGDGTAALYGGDGDDALLLGDQAGYADGGSGSDNIQGGAGDDTLEGGEHSALESAGDDTIDGGAGDDLIRGGYGADSLVGGEGDDVIDHQGRTEERIIVPQSSFDWHVSGDADTLDGGAGNDTLIMDRHDVATGGEGADVFELYHDSADKTADADTVAEITDFEVGSDYLSVKLNPQIGQNGEPDLVVQASPDGLDGHIYVNGDLVAVLKGAPDVSASDVQASLEPDIAP